MKRIHRFYQTAFRSPCRKGWRLVPISVDDLDRGAIDEAVGAGRVHIGGDDKWANKGAVAVIAGIRHLPERVILTTRLALPSAILGRVKRARDRRLGGAGYRSVPVKVMMAGKVFPTPG